MEDKTKLSVKEEKEGSVPHPSDNFDYFTEGKYVLFVERVGEEDETYMTFVSVPAQIQFISKVLEGIDKYPDLRNAGNYMALDTRVYTENEVAVLSSMAILFSAYSDIFIKVVESGDYLDRVNTDTEDAFLNSFYRGKLFSAS